MKLKRCCDCTAWIKYTLFVINFLIWVCGISLIIVGTWARLQKAKLGSVDNLSMDPAFFMLMIGIIIVIISTLGWCGALRENLCILKAFSISIIVLFLIEIAGGILTFVFLDKFQSHLVTYMRKAISIYQDDKDIQNALDYIQKSLECCGVVNYNDWDYNMYFNCSSPSQFSCGAPASCCKPMYGVMASTSKQCGFKSRKEGEAHVSYSIYMQGCIRPIMNVLKDNLLIVWLLAFSIGFVELLSITLTHLLIRQIILYNRNAVDAVGADIEMTIQTRYDTVIMRPPPAQ